MKTEVVIALIQLAGTIILAIIGKQYHKQVNGKMGELLDVTKKASKAEGNLEGRAEQKAEHG